MQEVNPIQVPDYSDILREIADNGKPRDNARTSTDPVQEQIDFERKLMSRRAAAGLTGDSKKIDSISRTVDDLKDDDITPISSCITIGNVHSCPHIGITHPVTQIIYGIQFSLPPIIQSL